MPEKNKRILIPTIIACLLLVISNLSSTGQSISNLAYLPLVSYDQSEFIGSNGGYLTSFMIDPTNPQVVYAGSWGSGVYKSQDGGQNWQPSNHGLGNLYINPPATSPTSSGIRFTGTSSGFFTYEAGSWTPLGLADRAVAAVAVDPTHPGWLYIVTKENGANFSKDAGLSWEVLDQN
jgi:photosystem II stability/assembly factor-like uncharacterized protein